MISDKTAELVDLLEQGTSLTVYPTVPPDSAQGDIAYVLPGRMEPGPRFGTLTLTQNVVVAAAPSQNIQGVTNAVYAAVAEVLAALRGSAWTLAEDGVEAPSKYMRGNVNTLGSVIVLRTVIRHEDLTT